MDTGRLVESAKLFCAGETGKPYAELFGVSDGKAIGTFVEHLFQNFLAAAFDVEVGNSAEGLDLPSVNTDIKVTSIRQPQSSCPFRDSKQKIFGLGYNLLVFVYDKHDDLRRRAGILRYVSCTFIDKSRTGDYQTTTGIASILANSGNADDIFAFLSDRHIPADDVQLMDMARHIVECPPQVGYLTVSNALQWRLQYGRVVALDKDVDGIQRIVAYADE